MEAGFWHNKWASGDIGFHLSEVNPLLVEHFAALALPAGSRVLLPLCGKTRDIAWLLAQGYRVAGSELSELAVEALFGALGIEPEVAGIGALRHYRAPAIDIYAGDFFALAAGQLGPVDAVYDRAALVALPAETRRRYAAHLAALSRQAPQLLINYEYDQALMAGPPFAVDAGEIERLYGGHYHLRCLARQRVEGGLKGRIDAAEGVWLLGGPPR